VNVDGAGVGIRLGIKFEVKGVSWIVERKRSFLLLRFLWRFAARDEGLGSGMSCLEKVLVLV